ncbi:Alanine racemase, N-terminal domain [Bifidobacterium bohemicum]|uniref:Pyridoxal phosphate homeostasis protein n=1 Tax=Bifidobacterium bohemicum DSM 22767 TaxID=1437606 RepID=A0A086ZEY6_9BIFI|nr:YggS family pyridoxal phosphate-dependent enzyme [Bifidobacterium bohemicum]KFI45086.1 alanine racemase domain protein [Bifidobacterium bohemicum DSM 22767]SCB91961.1 Alanine racemase, N-terminal domain [Bifidobacterium bohemicum]
MTAYMDHKDLANQLIDEARARQITDGVHRVLDTIAQAESAAGRPAGSVRLLAATKTRDVGEIMAAIDAGVRMIGENRPQEITAKGKGLVEQCAKRGFMLGTADKEGETGNFAGDASGSAVGVENGPRMPNDGSSSVVGAARHGSLSSASVEAGTMNDARKQGDSAPIGTGTLNSVDSRVVSTAGISGLPKTTRTRIPFHLIGQLQANKIGKVLPYVDVIESVDSQESAERISRRAVARDIIVGVLLEVNESGEASKSGCAPQAAVDLAQRVACMPGLRLDGFMTVGAHVDDERTIRKGFAHLRGVRDEVLASGSEGTSRCRELSMGMTHDMAFAVEEGSTIVRVGTAIFGERAFI